jgi:hypothetical protein
MLQTFEIIPFQANNLIESIRGEFEICEQQIVINFQLAGRINKVYWPEKDESPGRQFGLWEHTCLEFFIGPEDSSNYWEFNLSPNGNWNCFSFSDLRTDMQESEALVLSSVESEVEENTATCTALIHCDDLIHDIALSGIRIGISAVIEHTSGFFYYALAHYSNGESSNGESSNGEKARRPDFHARENHLLLL